MAQQSAPSAAVVSAISEVGTGLILSKYLLFAAYAAAIYDHVVTLDIEITYMWMRKISVVTVLFFVTRYYFLFVLTMSVFVFYQPLVNVKAHRLTHESCERTLLFIPIGGGTILSAATNLIIMLRIYALYEKSKMLAFILLSCVLAQVGLGLWNDLSPSVSRLDIFTALGYPELDNLPMLHSCLPQLSTRLPGIENSLSQVVQIIFDTVAVALILFKARKHGNGGLVALIARQGLAYYMLNICTYFSWGFMLMFAPTSIEQVMAGPAIGLLCISVNRLTLHLRRCSAAFHIYVGDGLSQGVLFTPHGPNRRRRHSWLGASTLEISVETWEAAEQEVHELDIVASDVD